MAKKEIGQAELDSALASQLRDWRLSANALVRTFEFPDFKQALAFVNRVGEKAEEMQHHPDVDIRYNKVTLTLTTHDVGGISRRDLELAGHIQKLESGRERPRSAA